MRMARAAVSDDENASKEEKFSSFGDDAAAETCRCDHEFFCPTCRERSAYGRGSEHGECIGCRAVGGELTGGLCGECVATISKPAPKRVRSRGPVKSRVKW